MNRIILHVDMNSYFATVEQQANPLLRGKPIAVSGRPHIHSVVAAASIEAKKFGVKSGMNTWEAKKICPGLIFIPGDPAKYIDLTGKLIRIFRDYTPLVEIFSIDEAFLELTPCINGDALYRTGSLGIASEIKSRIKRELGSYLTCSIGIAKNKLLAKLASEKKKPDGLTIIDDNNLNEMLLSSRLSDFCGIGRKVLAHLQSMGIYSVAQLRKIPEEYLIAAFGVRGREIRNMAFGVDDSPVIPEYESPQAKSFSHTLTLERATNNRTYVEAVLLYLAEKTARRMRQEKFCGRIIHSWVGFRDLGGCGNQKSLSYYTDSGKEVFFVARGLLESKNPLGVIRSVGIGISGLTTKSGSNASLLLEEQREEKIINSLDAVNDRFGENSIFRAAMLPAFAQDREVAGIRVKLRFN